MKYIPLIPLILGMALVAAIIWGSFWLVKTGSYKLWYEDMVVDTVRKTVIEQCLTPHKRRN